MGKGKFTTVNAQQVKGTLVRSFVPLADSLRDLLTKFGLRTYRVSIIRVQWSGGRRGVGAPVVIASEDILPTPKISDLTALTEFVQPVGQDEIGGIEVSKISGRYTEDQLRGLGAGGEEIPADQEVFWEVAYPDPASSTFIARRFQVRSAPTFSPGSFQWTVRLERSHEDRNRDNGDVE